MEGGSSAGIVGRTAELAELARFVDSVTHGPSCLVLEGSAGGGKTTLWRAAIDLARERVPRVLEARPVAAEATLAFAGLGDLLGGVLDEILERLPEPQAEALQVALMLRRPSSEPQDGRAVAFAALSALRALTAQAPVLLAVDDVQWLDASSASVLAFAWRRLREEPVVIVAGFRTGEPAPDLIAPDERTKRLAVKPLSVGAVHELLRSRFGSPLPRPVLLRLYEVAAGNAFYALALGRALAEREVVPAPGEPLPVPERLRDLMRDRLVALPDATRDAVTAAAALTAPTLRLLAGGFGGELALRPALEAEVLDVDGDRLRFRHPLLASAAYEELDPISRRDLHRRLADLFGDGEERARHLALAADGPDSEVAAALEEAAVQARARGASAAAAELCELARRLTPPQSAADGYRRLLLAGRYRWMAGDTPTATRHLEEVIAASGDRRLRAEAKTTLAFVLQLEGDHPRAADLSRSALAEPGIDDALRAEAASRLAMILLFMREDLHAGVHHARLAADVAERLGDRVFRAHTLGILLVLQVMAGSSEAHETEQMVTDALDASGWAGGIRSARYDRANAAMWSDRHEEAVTLLRDIHEQAVLEGDEGAIPHVLAQLALGDFLAGRWSDAIARAEAGYEAALQAGQRLSRAWTRSTRALVRASLGLEAEARADAAEALALAGPRGMAVARIQSVWALGLLELPLDRPLQAAQVLTPLREQLLRAGVGEPGAVRFIPDEIEALIALGRRDEAVEVLGWLEERASALDRASALAAAARCRGLLAAERGDTDGALASFERALAEHERVLLPFERARTLLALGATYRRAKHRAAARATLEEALAVFGQLGAGLWGAKANAELARIGGRAPAGGQLTVTERRLAELVARGLSNKEAAAALFVTPKTVETQLSRVYAKLGIHSRMELAVRINADRE
ncbi:MAG: AAA family ATPase [Actinobacteria bacterium]|nr:AAA family ATPase [Actinomycetota bacterium]